jgi:hypothetical protein
VNRCGFFMHHFGSRIVKENSEYFKNTPFLEMNLSKLFIYLFDRHVLKWPRYSGVCTLDKQSEVTSSHQT